MYMAHIVTLGEALATIRQSNHTIRWDLDALHRVVGILHLVAAASRQIASDQ